MTTLTHTYSPATEIYVVDPLQNVMFHGTILTVKLSEYLDNDGVVGNKVIYLILLDNDRGTIHSTEEYMALTQADGLLILSDLFDGEFC